jgi:hypothetical protein
MAVDSVRIRGRVKGTDPYGVVNFEIEGSSDGATWDTIISSERTIPTSRNWTTEARLPSQSAAAYPRIRLRQTGKCARPAGKTQNDHLVLTCVDFGGTIVYPAGGAPQ